MPHSKTSTALKSVLRGLPSILSVIGGLSFFVGGRVIHEFGKMDRLLAEILGIAIAFVCLIGIVVAKHVLDNIEWEEANQQAAASESKKS